MKLYIDVGHGGNDPGAIGINKIEEEDINLAVAKYLRTELEWHGINVMLSRTDDTAKKNEVKANEANTWGADYVCSLHCNAYDKESANGTEVLIYKKGGQAEKLAKKVLPQIVSVLKTTNRGIKERSGLIILNSTVAPAILCEIAFVTNKKDKSKIDEAHEQKAVAIAICKGICEHCGIAYKGEAKVNKTKFKDEGKMSKWAIDSIVKASESGIMNGDTDGNFRPKDNLTREEAAVIVAKLLDK
jgi:N-acetylmuramoyl-L-alanine amidase